MSSQEHKEKIWNYIKDIKTCMLVTEDQGFMHARPMHIVQDDYDNKLWFFTSKSSEKVSEVQNKHRVCLTFSDTEKNVYVSLSGHAHLTQDKTLIDKFWNKVVAAWFPDGKESEDVALLEIKIDKGEHWDATSNPATFMAEIAKANIKDETPDLGENRKFG
ncbi:MAG: pyridoxamine 5'-phosphate oxidase family protein [Alphaproteobacteria bacterium]